jgi:hypothetical protein
LTFNASSVRLRLVHLCRTGGAAVPVFNLRNALAMMTHKRTQMI